MITVRIVMAVHQPDLRLLARQIGSLAAQRDVATRLTIVLDGEQDPSVCQWLAAPPNPNTEWLLLTRRQGPQAAFLLGLHAALAAAGPNDLFAFCDQDDFWHPEKLVRQAERLRQSNAALVHCDARVVNEAGDLVHPSLHVMERRSRDYAPASLIMMNSVTGMTALFDRRAAELALELGAAGDLDVLHDHIVALAAALSGGVSAMDEALVDYTQHGRNVIGASDRSRHGVKIAAFLKPAPYVRRCREQFLARAYLFARVAEASGIDPAIRSFTLAEAEKLFGGHIGCGSLVAHAARRMARGETRMARMAMRCVVGKIATLFQAAGQGGLRRFDRFLAAQSASLMRRKAETR